MPTAGAGLYAIIWVASHARATSKGNSIALLYQVSKIQPPATSNQRIPPAGSPWRPPGRRLGVPNMRAEFCSRNRLGVQGARASPECRKYRSRRIAPPADLMAGLVIHDRAAIRNERAHAVVAQV